MKTIYYWEFGVDVQFYGDGGGKGTPYPHIFEKQSENESLQEALERVTPLLLERYPMAERREDYSHAKTGNVAGIEIRTINEAQFTYCPKEI